MTTACFIPKRSSIAAACAALTFASVAFAGSEGPPYDFSDAFYLANGIDPTTIVGRPDGTPPGSVIDPAGPPDADHTAVRILSHTAAYDGSGHPIFFYVLGLPSLASFTDDDAGAEAFAIAEEFKVYEFPRATNPPFAVFPKRQDLIADLSGGYFSGDPLGTWQINLVRYTPAAFETTAGQQALADLAQDNGFDLDGTPLIRTLSEVESLAADGFVTIEVPPLGGPDFRWFFCPIIENPEDGAIAPDAFLEVTEGIAAAEEFIELFHCLQTTGDDQCEGVGGTCPADLSGDGVVNGIDLAMLLADWGDGTSAPDLDDSGVVNGLDLAILLGAWGACS
jgi:hypothetical protein